MSFYIRKRTTTAPHTAGRHAPSGRSQRKALKTTNASGTWPSARRQILALRIAQRQRARRGTR